MTINLNLRKDTRGRMHPDDLSTPPKELIYTNRAISQTEILTWLLFFDHRYYQEVQLKRSDGKNTIRASDPQTDGQLNTTLPSLAMIVTLSLLILLVQRAAVRPSLSKTIHAHHYTNTMTTYETRR